MGVVGQPVKRKEDRRLITGYGEFLEDIKLPGMLYAVFVRSPVAHGKIVSIDTSEAENYPGVVAVFTARDLEGKVNDNPVAWIVPDSNQADVKRPLLARDKVRFMGEPVAVVIAESRQAAYDAAELVYVDYEDLPAVVQADEAVKDGAPLVHEHVPNNIALKWHVKGGDVEKAFSEADRIIKQRIHVHRAAPVPLEPRGAVAKYNPGKDKLTVWVTTQNAHIHRFLLSVILNEPEHKIRVITPDVGGGFGAKIPVYIEEAVVSFAAMQLKRPVKWVETRSEHFVSSIHGRDFIGELEFAVKSDGKILGIKGRNYGNLGAYYSTISPGCVTVLHGLILPGTYDIQAFDYEMYGVFTNTAPTDADRGAGRPEALFFLERMVDIIAQELGLDPVEVRKKNLLPPGENIKTVTGLVYDSADYQKAMNKALELADYEGLRKQQEELRKEGRYIGIGVVSHIDICGFAPSKVVGAVGLQAGQWESAIVRVHPTGKVTIVSGASPHGQGSDTTYSQIVSDILGIPIEDIELVYGDTDAVQMGWGTYGSRGAATGGTAVAKAAKKVFEKAKMLAAHFLETEEENLEFKDGVFVRKDNPEKKITIQDVALQANVAWNLPEGVEPGLEAEVFYDPSNFTYPFGTHICVVEVDPETGQVDFLKYLAVDDAGNILNPLLADGQVQGGIVHGIGHSMYEAIVYSEDGQLLTGSFNEYALPKAHLVPHIENHYTITPSNVNELGVKGIGEAGAIAAQVCVANAIIDALKPFGIKHLDSPYTPARIWKAIQEAKQNGGKA